MKPRYSFTLISIPLFINCSSNSSGDSYHWPHLREMCSVKEEFLSQT